MRGARGVQDRPDGGGAGDVVGQDEEAVLAGNDAQAVALTETGTDEWCMTEVARNFAYLSNTWFCASAAWRRAHCRSADLSSSAPVQNLHTIDASRSSMKAPGVLSVNWSRM